MQRLEDSASARQAAHLDCWLFDWCYRLEPLIRLEDESLVGGEVLRHGRMPRFAHRWRSWYSHVGRLQQEYSGYYRLFVNLDTDHILDQKLVDCLLANASDPRMLVLEWTEKHAEKAKLERAADILKDLRAQHGLSICVDDFGAGMDGIRRLQLCSPDIVKIDGNLLHAARGHNATQVLYRHIASLLKDAGAVTVAEWIETPEDMEFACTAGVDLGQGFRWPHAQGRI